MRCDALLAMALNFSVAVLAEAHVGDRVFPIPELTDEMLARIDLNDGLVDDWIDVVGEPVLTPVDFTVRSDGLRSGIADDVGNFDATDLDFRIWLAWHDDSDKMLVAGQFADDGFKSAETIEMFNLEEDRVFFFVDGDHSGPPYLISGLGNFHSTAQEYEAMAVVAEGPNVYLCCPQESGVWMANQPYSDGGGGALSENPTIWVVEFLITPFDHILWDDPDGSIASTLEAGEVIGLTFSVTDTDFPQSDITYYTLTGTAWWEDKAADGLLLGAGEIFDDGSVVIADSWARIKASLAK